MEKQWVLEKLQSIFQDIFGDYELKIDENTSPVDIEAWDSLTQISILEVVQDEFNISFSLDEMIELTDVGKMVGAIVCRIS